MLRSAVRLHASKRLLATGSESTVHMTKKSNGFKKFFYGTTIGLALFYGGGVALSEYNDNFAEQFTAYVPFAEELVDRYEAYKYLGSKKHEISPAGLKDRIQDLVYGDPKKIKSVEPIALVVEDVEIIPTELLDLELIQLDQALTDPKFFKVVDDLNKTIDTILKQNIKLKESQIKYIVQCYKTLQNTISTYNKDITTSIQKVIDEKLKESKAILDSEYEQKSKKKEVELTKSFISEFNTLKDNLDKRYAAELASDLRANEQTLLAKHANEVTLLSITQVEEFTKIIKEKVDKERNGRLGRLEELRKEVENLSGSVDKVNKLLMKKEATTQITLLLTAIKQKLINPFTPDKGISIEPELKKLKLLSSMLPGTGDACDCPSKCKPTCKCNGCLKKKSLIDLTIKELDTIIKDKKIPSNEQLLNRWNLLENDFKTSSLLPQNPGILGHVSAKFFSLLLFTKRGVSPDGKDLDSIYGQINENIRLSKINNALTAAVSLQGWPHIVCQDWIEDAKLKLEVETLVDILDTEIRSL